MLGVNSSVNYNGRIATIAELFAEGKLILATSDNFATPPTWIPRKAWFADIVGEDGNGYRITQKAYNQLASLPIRAG